MVFVGYWVYCVVSYCVDAELVVGEYFEVTLCVFLYEGHGNEICYTTLKAHIAKHVLGVVLSTWLCGELCPLALRRPEPPIPLPRIPRGSLPP